MFHQKHYLPLVFFAGIMQGITLPANITKARIDGAGNVVSGPHYPPFPQPNIVIVDSSANEFSMWTQVQECLGYNPSLGALQFVCRNYGNGNYLDSWQSDSAFSSSITDLCYHGELGPARYPTSVAGVNPYATFSYLIGGGWGGMGGVYDSGGWYSSLWSQPVDVGTGDLGIIWNIGKQLPNGNILFIGVSINSIYWSTYTEDLLTRLAGGVVAPPPSYYWGFDINGGIGYLFYYSDSLYYVTTTDEITWSPPQSYNVVFPNPYPNNMLDWTQTAVTDAGNPILVFNVLDLNDSTYPQYGKVYISYAPGQPCIEVGTTSPDAENLYPTIATGGNYVVVLFGQPRSGTGQYTFWDIYYNYSTDNGVTWSIPKNLTANITDHNNCLWQIAKRVDATGNGQFFFAFGCAIPDPLLDLYWNITNNGTPVPSRWYVGRNSIVGIAEGKAEIPEKFSLKISPNPAINHLCITYTLLEPDMISLKLYDVNGRLVQTLDNGYRQIGCYTVRIDTKELASGTYIIVLDTKRESITKIAIVVH